VHLVNFIELIGKLLSMPTSSDIQFFSCSDPGKVRRNNEDFLKIDSTLQIAAVADGMGGNDYGEVASQLAVDACIEYLRQTSEEVLNKYPCRELGNAIKYANETIITIQRNEEKYRSMGTTLTCLWVTDDQLHYSWVGDSRIYLIRSSDKTIKQLTTDHTLDRDKIDATLAPDLYRRAPSILTQKIGSILLIKPDCDSTQIAPGDIILACTDGLSDKVSDDLMLDYAIGFKHSLNEYGEKLLDRALDCGGQDNISFILAKL
jgi:serine/threonine protein phosphatase PrpC